MRVQPPPPFTPGPLTRAECQRLNDALAYLHAAVGDLCPVPPLEGSWDRGGLTIRLNTAQVVQDLSSSTYAYSQVFINQVSNTPFETITNPADTTKTYNFQIPNITTSETWVYPSALPASNNQYLSETVVGGVVTLTWVTPPVVLGTAGAVPQWIKGTTIDRNGPNNNLNVAAATPQTIAVYTLPAKCVLLSVKTVLTTTFAGGSMTTITLNIHTGNNNYFVDTQNYISLSAPAARSADTGGSGTPSGCESESAGTTINCIVTGDGVHNFSALTAGQLDFYFLVSDPN